MPFKFSASGDRRMENEKTYRYSKLANILKDQIFSGYIQPGEYLPSEHQLCNQYSLSRTSVRKSLELLAGEGLIIKKVGAGTMVNPDLVVPKEQNRTLHILVTSPLYFIENEGLSVIVDAFKQQYPHVDVKLLQLSGDTNFNDALRKQHEHGLHPDLVLSYDSQMRDMDDFSLFLDLEPAFRDSLAHIYPRIVQGLRFDEGLKAIPITFSPVFLTYNPDLFESRHLAKPDAGWTRNDFMEAARQLTFDANGDGILDQYGYSFSPGINRWPVFPLQNGLMDPDAAPYEDILLETCTLIHDLLHRTRSAVLFAANTNRVHDHPFKNGKAAMTLTTTYELSAWKSESLSFEPEIGPLPFGPYASTLIVTNSLLIPKTSPHVELAQAFVRTAVNPDVQKRMCMSTEFLSVIPEVNEAVKSPKLLEFYNITKERMAHNYYVHELFPDLSVMEELISKMDFFWLGLETAAAFARKWRRIAPRMG
jgi:multiple sugar transport system substrate-binding protein